MTKIDIDPAVVIDLYRELGTHKAVAQELGVSEWWVGDTLRKNGVRRERTSYYREFDHQKIWELWQAGHTKDQIAEEIGTSPQYIYHLLRNKFGVEFPPNHPHKYDLPMDELAERYRAGESCGEIARSLDLPGERIRRRLISHGVKIRSAAVSVPRGKKNVFYKNGKGKVDIMHYHRRQTYEVAAICLGQPVPQGWVIHHRDEDKTNNNPENLMLFESASAHSKYHQKLLRLQRKGFEVDATQKALESGGAMLPQPPTPIEFEDNRDLHDLFETLRRQSQVRILSSPKMDEPDQQ